MQQGGVCLDDLSSSRPCALIASGLIRSGDVARCTGTAYARNVNWPVKPCARQLRSWSADPFLPFLVLRAGWGRSVFSQSRTASSLSPCSRGELNGRARGPTWKRQASPRHDYLASNNQEARTKNPPASEIGLKAKNQDGWLKPRSQVSDLLRTASRSAGCADAADGAFAGRVACG